MNIFHINVRNFHNNDRPNKTALTILSQLKITKVNIIEKFWKGKQQNHYRKCKNTKKKGK